MRTLIAVAMLLAQSAAAAQTPSDIITIHVRASHWTHSLTTQNPGDYRARLVSEHRESAYELRQSYEILLPNKRTRTFVVTGVQE